MKHEGYIIGYGDEQDRREILIPDCNESSNSAAFKFCISIFHKCLYLMLCVVVVFFFFS